MSVTALLAEAAAIAAIRIDEPKAPDICPREFTMAFPWAICSPLSFLRP
jgi:hypothetical protein